MTQTLRPVTAPPGAGAADRAAEQAADSARLAGLLGAQWRRLCGFSLDESRPADLVRGDGLQRAARAATPLDYRTTKK